MKFLVHLSDGSQGYYTPDCAVTLEQVVQEIAQFDYIFLADNEGHEAIALVSQVVSVEA
jgi:hypothetical protein